MTGNDGLITTLSVYSWTITAADLLLGGELIEPQAGDFITETLNGEEIEWQVLRLDDNSDCWEWLDSSKILLLVHTKKV